MDINKTLTLVRNLKIRDILLQATNQVKSAKTSYSLKPAGIDYDGHIAYDLHVERFLELCSPISNLKCTFIIGKTGEISQENSHKDIK